MKLAKSHKIILTVLAFALSIMLAFCALNVFTGKAAEDIASPVASNYFTGSTAEFGAEGLKVTAEKNKKLTIKNELSIDNMEIDFGTAENLSGLKMILTYDSFYVNGNKNASGDFDKEIVNTFDIPATGTVTIKVENGQVKVNGTAKTEAYYKIRKVDKAISKIEFEPVLASEGVAASYVIKSIDQDANNLAGKYEQSLAVVDGKLSPALPAISLDAEMFVRDADGNYSMKAFANSAYSLSYQVCSVLGNVTATELYPTVDASANVKIAQNVDKTAQDEIHVQSSANATESFNIVDKDGEVVATYTATILKKGEANQAPNYDLDADALEAFKAALKKEYLKDEKFVPLGTKIELPSMEDFVYDDRTPYDRLTKKLYYASREENSADKLEFTLDYVGNYYLYVVFTDSEDQAMDKDEFIKQDDKTGVVTYGQFKDYIFSFRIDEDTEIVVKAPSKQGNGYKGTRYTASKFDITSSNCNIIYTLEYATSEEAGDWKEIKKFSDVEEGYDDGNYDYETLKAINYDGQYTFTPDKMGVYRITVDVSSKMSFMHNSMSTIINVNEEAKVIEPTVWDWISDNVLAVVFLGVGSICLIGIIVLLCIKPKTKKDED